MRRLRPPTQARACAPTAGVSAGNEYYLTLDSCEKSVPGTNGPLLPFGDPCPYRGQRLTPVEILLSCTWLALVAGLILRTIRQHGLFQAIAMSTSPPFMLPVLRS